ncbi:MAG: hypothetical protein ACP5C3_05640 [Methanomicrobiales archaeon]
MGELSDTLEEFKKISSDFHQKLMNILKENYCWKCPMRTTSSKTFCRELDAWVRLTHSLEEAVENNLEEKISKNGLLLLQMKYLTKINRNLPLYDRRVLVVLKKDLPPYASKENVLIIDEKCGNLKQGVIVLIPEICPLHAYGFSRIKYSDNLPFKLVKVSKVFHEAGGRFIETEEGFKINQQLLMGRVIAIMDKKEFEFL